MLKIMKNNNNNSNNNTTTSLSPHHSLDHVGNREGRQRNVGEDADPTRRNSAPWLFGELCRWDGWSPRPRHLLEGVSHLPSAGRGGLLVAHLGGGDGAFPQELLRGERG